jgi:hypothetical protein
MTFIRVIISRSFEFWVPLGVDFGFWVLEFGSSVGCGV